MDRNREARRGTVAAVNGGGLSRRRQRNGGYRDSPDEDGGMEMQETGRLRDRASKKDRERDRSGRNKRRRGERILHPSNREEGEDSSEESLDEEDDDEEDDASVAVRLPPPPVPNPGPASSISLNHHRKSFPLTAKVPRQPAVWKPADEMIGVPVPRRARSSSAKRSQEFAGSGGGGGGGEPVHRQASTSPARPSPSSTTPISPRKKMKPVSGNKHRPPKISKPSSSVHEQDELEIEVAEVLFGLTRQFQPPPKQEIRKLDSKDTNGSGNEAKSRVSSPISISPQPAVSQPSVLPPPNPSSNTTPLSATAPKRKRPRPVKFEDESPTSPVSLLALPCTSVSSAPKIESEQPAKTEASSPRSEKNAPSPAIENGGDQCDLGVS